MSQLYRSDQTNAAQDVLEDLRRVAPDAIVIGGWAVWLYTEGQRSTDVDIIVDFEGLSRIQAAYGPAVTKNDRIRKYELTVNRVSIDVLVLETSDAGIPVSRLIDPLRTVSGFRVISPEGLIAMKACAWIDRSNTLKGFKDEIDIISMLRHVPISWARYAEIVSHASGRFLSQLPGIIHRIIASADRRDSWREVMAYGLVDLPSAHAWARARRDLLSLLPADA